MSCSASLPSFLFELMVLPEVDSFTLSMMFNILVGSKGGIVEVMIALNALPLNGICCGTLPPLNTGTLPNGLNIFGKL